jgi:antitoxin MazE
MSIRGISTSSSVDLQVVKWGNSLALRIPAEVVRRLDLREEAVVEAQLTVDGGLSIRPTQWSRLAFALELTEARSAMSMSEAVMEELRSGARY